MKESEVIKLVTIAQALWPNWRAPSEPDTFRLAVEAWGAILGDVPAPLALAALHSLATSGREFAPPVGLIRLEALQLVSRADGTAAPDVDVAWGEVQRAAAQRGYMAGEPGWSHEAISNAVFALGWKDICHSTNPEALRAHFFKVYGSSAARAERERNLPPSVVAIAQAQARIGHRMPEIGS